FYKEQKVDVLLNKTVTNIAHDKKRVLLDDSTEVGYEKLLIATGGKPIVPKIKGIDKKGVYRFLTLDHVKEIRESIGNIDKAVVIGGGLSGIKAAEGLSGAGVKVTVVELMDRILKPVFDEKGSEIVEGIFKQNGVEVITSISAAEILGKAGEDDCVGGVLLSDGREVSTDVVVVAVGVIPQTGFLKDTGMEIDRGIPVDEAMKTGIADIYAAGDVVESFDIVLGTRRLIPIWPKAYNEGRVAGFNMAGVDKKNAGSFAMNAADFFGFPTISAGLTNPGENDGCEVLSEYREDNEYYKKLVFRDSRLVGMVLMGDAVDRAGIALNLIKKKIDVRAFKDRLMDRDVGLISLPRELVQDSFEGVFLR
ncbi:MAG: NAD(P)/FAD-dependent oxidoreductase, partial [Thermodesulfobacteriota bacterium]